MEKFVFEGKDVVINGNYVDVPYAIKHIVNFAKSRKYDSIKGFWMDDVDLETIKNNLRNESLKSDKRKEFIANQDQDKLFQIYSLVRKLRDMQESYVQSSKNKREFESIQSELRSIASTSESSIIKTAMSAKYNRPDRDVIKIRTQADLIDSMM